MHGEIHEKNEQDQQAGLSVVELVKQLEKGALTSLQLADALLEHIKNNDENIHAFAYVDEELVREQARNADMFRLKGRPLGPLHGIPVAIKDIIDTKDMPTQYGTPFHKGRKPNEDATLISLLKEAGAIILGKTVTAEFAYLKPGPTRNPHNLEHTPGGSSSGSAAAVAAAMSPLAIGTQTNGSVIRPGAYCGIYAFKPTFGRISRNGVLRTSAPLDTIGLFGRSLEDLAILADVVMSYDSRDQDMVMTPKPQITRVMAEDPPAPPSIAFIRSPVWHLAEQSTKDAFRELIEFYGEKTITIVDLPPLFDQAHDALSKIMAYGFAENFSEIYKNNKDQLSDEIIENIERGQNVTTEDFEEALNTVGHFKAVFDEILEDFDAILTPSAPGEAPEGIKTTGNPAFCTIWTMCGLPALNLPILEGPKGLPVGAQLVGDSGDDARLFRTAKWMVEKLTNETDIS